MSYQKTWQKRCDVKYCVNTNNYLVTFFPTPKDPNLFKQWQQAVQCTGTILPQNGRVCEKHFCPKDIMEFTCLKKSESSNSSNNVDNENIKLRVPINGAVPSRFDDEIAKYCKQNEIINEELTLNSVIVIEQNRTNDESFVPCIESNKSETSINVPISEEKSLHSVPIKKIVQSLNNTTNSSTILSKVDKKSTFNKDYVNSDILNSSLIKSNSEENSLSHQKQLVPPEENTKPKINNNEKKSSIQIIKVRSMKDTFFEKMYKRQIEPRLPNKSWNIHNCEEPQKGLIFAELAELSSDYRVPPILKKSVFFDENFNVRIYFFGKLFPNVEYDPPKGINDVEEFLRQIDSLKICEGGPRLTELTNSKFAFRDEAIYKWRHNNCELRLEKGQVCKNCLLLCKTVGERNINLSTISHSSTKRIRIDPNEGKIIKNNT